MLHVTRHQRNDIKRCLDVETHPVEESPPPPYKHKNTMLDSYDAQVKVSPTRSDSTPARQKAHGRLLQIARQHNISLSYDKPRMVQTAFKPICSTPAHDSKARALLEQRRLEDPEYKAPGGAARFFKSKDSLVAFAQKELNRTLAFAVSQGDDPGTIDALMKMGADVNVVRRASTKLLKKISKKDQDDRRSDLLVMAVTKGYFEIVHVLASEADQTSLNEALPNAINSGDLHIIKSLLERGADPIAAESEILQAIADGSEDVVELILRAPRQVSGDCCTLGLILAVKQGSARNTILLLLNAADADYDGGRAFINALASCRRELAVAMVLAPFSPSSSSLDEAVAFVYALENVSMDMRLELVEICLAGGAYGDKTGQTLVLATHGGETSMIKLLLSYGASVDAYSGAAIQQTIIDVRLNLLELLLGARPHPATLAVALKRAVSLAEEDKRYSITSMLLRAGATGILAVSEVLVDLISNSSNQEDERLIKLLLELGEADVNHEHGKSVRVAVQRGLPEILQMLLSQVPSTETVNAAISLASRADEPLRTRLMQQLLQAGANGESVHDALISAAETPVAAADITSKLQLCQLLLKNGASVDHKNGRALASAAANADSEVLELLMSARPSQASAANAVLATQSQCRAENKSEIVYTLVQYGVPQETLDATLLASVQQFDGMCLEVVKILLSAGASPLYSDAASILYAAKLRHLPLLEALAPFAKDNILWSRAFGVFVDSPEAEGDWLNLEHLALIQFLFERGASGHIVNNALVRVVSGIVEGKAGIELLDLFLSHQASVNHDHGKVVQLAAERGDSGVLAKLMKHNPTQETIDAAFMSMLRTGQDPISLCKMIDLFMSQTMQPNVKRGSANQSLFVALQNYPTSANVIHKLCSIGCEVDLHIDALVCPQDLERPTPEKTTLLIWALLKGSSESSPVSLDVMSVLINANANVNYASATSKTTPLILAARNRRADVIFELIQHGANVASRDCFDRSALFYAARNGDLLAMTNILNSRPSPNDGSLHEAARELHSEAVRLLMENGHRPDFASTKHAGRTALAELCLQCNAVKKGGEIEMTIDTLIAGGIDPLKKCAGRTALFFALENLEPISITQKLLDRIFWEYVEHANNIAKCGLYFYSPTMYIKKGFVPLNERQAQQLLMMLYNFDAEDHFYAAEGQNQPPDAVGLPPVIEEYEHKKRLREERRRQEDEDHQRAKARMLDNAGLDRLIKQGAHEQGLEHGDERFHQNLHGLEITSMTQTALEQNRRAYETLDTQRDRGLELGYIQRKDDQRLLTQGREQNLSITHQRATNYEALSHQTNTLGTDLAYQFQSDQTKLATHLAQNQLHVARETAQLGFQDSQNQLHSARETAQLAFQAGQNNFAAEANRNRILTERAHQLAQLQGRQALNGENERSAGQMNQLTYTHQETMNQLAYGHLGDMNKLAYGHQGQMNQLSSAASQAQIDHARRMAHQTARGDQRRLKDDEYRHKMKMLEMSQDQSNEVVRGKVQALKMIRN